MSRAHGCADEGPGEDAGDDVGEDVGSVAEEAARLFGALSDWAGDRTGGPGLDAGLAGLVGQVAAAAQDVGEHLAEGGDDGAPECRWCPVCRAAHVVRQTSPEVRAHLASAASSLLQAAAGLLATSVPADARSRPGPGVERIDLDDPDGGDAEGQEEEDA